MKVKVCQNHLAHFFEALVKGDTAVVKRIEHQLAAEEECVACAYLLRARGEARNEAEEFLTKEGFLNYLTVRGASEMRPSTRSTVKTFLLFFLLAAVVSGLLTLIYLRSVVYFS